MKQKLYCIILCLAMIIALPSCTNGTSGRESQTEAGSSNMADELELLFDIDQTNESSPASVRKTYEKKVLLKLDTNEQYLCHVQDDSGLHILIRSESTNELHLLSSSDDTNWKRTPYAAEAEKAFQTQYPGSYEVVSAIAASDGTYYSVRSTQGTAPDDIKIVSLRPNASNYDTIDTSGWYTQKETETFYAMTLMAPTADRLVLVCEINEGKKMTVGEYVDEYRGGDPGYAFADRDPNEVFEPVISQRNMALLLDRNTMEIVKKLDYSDGGQWMFGEGRWFANRTHLFFKDDNQDEFTFHAYSLETGQAVADLATNTEYNNWYWPGYNMFFASDAGVLYWINNEGVHRVVSGGSLVEGIFELDLFDLQDCRLEDFSITNDGGFLVVNYQIGEETTVYKYL